MRLIDADKLKHNMIFECCTECDCCTHVRYEGGNHFCGLIETAPTATVDNYSMGSQDGVRKVLSERPKGKWIPVSERLPEKSGDYLVRPSDGVLEDYSDFSEVMIMPYESDCEAFGWWSDRYDPVSLGYLDSDFVEFEVIAWQPLPEPYKEADNDPN